LPFLGYFFNEPTKSSLSGEKSPNLVTLNKIQLGALEMAKANLKVVWAAVSTIS
jgi:hypothetical protein